MKIEQMAKIIYDIRSDEERNIFLLAIADELESEEGAEQLRRLVRREEGLYPQMFLPQYCDWDVYRKEDNRNSWAIPYRILMSMEVEQVVIETNEPEEKVARVQYGSIGSQPNPGEEDNGLFWFLRFKDQEQAWLSLLNALNRYTGPPDFSEGEVKEPIRDEGSAQ